MVGETADVQISYETYLTAQKLAARDHVSVAVLLESLIRRHVEYVESLEAFSDMPKFSLVDYEMQRDPGETDAEYEARIDLFR